MNFFQLKDIAKQHDHISPLLSLAAHIVFLQLPRGLVKRVATYLPQPDVEIKVAGRSTSLRGLSTTTTDSEAFIMIFQPPANYTIHVRFEEHSRGRSSLIFNRSINSTLEVYE